MRRVLTAAGLWMVLAMPMLCAGQRQADPLNDQQTEDLREYADRPVEKLKLFLKYIEQRANEIHQLNTDSAVQNRNAQLHNLYAEFTRISDELEDNMESYDEQHADLRKALKEVLEKSEKWPAVLKEPAANAEYDLARVIALDANQSVHDDAKKMLADEARYFSEHKSGGG